MTSVIRQEWKRRSSNTYTTSIVLAAVNLLAMALYYFGNGQEPILPFLPKWVVAELFIPIVIVIDTIGFFLGVMFDNASNMKDMLFKDNGYLMKLVPVNSWKLIGGKYITGLFELLFYGVQNFVYILMFTLIGSHRHVVTDHSDIMSLSQFTEVIFTAIAALIILWLLVNTFMNLVRTMTSVVTKRWKVPKAVIYIVSIVIAWLTLKLTGNLIDGVFETSIVYEGGIDLRLGSDKALSSSLSAAWTLIGIWTAISGLYYSITCVLFDKCVEV